MVGQFRIILMQSSNIFFSFMQLIRYANSCNTSYKWLKQLIATSLFKELCKIWDDTLHVILYNLHLSQISLLKFSFDNFIYFAHFCLLWNKSNSMRFVRRILRRGGCVRIPKMLHFILKIFSFKDYWSLPSSMFRSKSYNFEFWSFQCSGCSIQYSDKLRVKNKVSISFWNRD